MSLPARITFLSGILVLLLSLINVITTNEFSPSLDRAEILAAISGVGFMLVSVLWSRANPLKANNKKLEGEEGFILDQNLINSISKEIAWGSYQFLTATPAASLLIFWKGKTILKRGIINKDIFKLGPISQKSIRDKKLISLVNTNMFPGSYEFDSLVKDLPAVMVYPLGSEGVVIIGGLSERCFSKSDEKWFTGWCDKLNDELSNKDFI